MRYLTQLLQHGAILIGPTRFRKEIVDVQIITAMNPTSGFRDLRTRSDPVRDVLLCHALHHDLKQSTNKSSTDHVDRFDKKAKETAPFIVSASIALIDKVASKFYHLSDSRTSGRCAR